MTESGIGDCWLDMSVNASHYSGPHHVLFEGNWGDNLDSDNTHGNSTYITFFRNRGTGLRTPFDDPSIGSTALVDDYTGKAYYCPSGLASCVAKYSGAFARGWADGVQLLVCFRRQRTGGVGHDDCGEWLDLLAETSPDLASSCSDGTLGTAARIRIWTATTASYILINGNYDYLDNAVKWQGSPLTLPNSFYLSSKPAFFTAGSGYTWPWVTPTGSEQIQTGPSGCGGTCSGLPAQARWQAGTPFVQP